jgi:uncharacterized protein
MRILITGGAGFIGQQLARALAAAGHQLVIADRHRPRFGDEYYVVDIGRDEVPLEAFRDLDGVVHLAGRSIFDRWNPEIKQAILRSRVDSTRQLVSTMARLAVPPRVFVCASAVGYYGDRGEEDLEEGCSPGSDFLSEVCVAWEKEAGVALGNGTRVVNIRTAPVLGNGGMLAKLLPIYRLGLGGPLAGGRQWSPWVHMRDIIGIYKFALENESLSGPVNACAPDLVRNRQFSDTLGATLTRPAILPVPRFALRFMFNDLADAVLCSQKVHPRRLTEAGYAFQFPQLGPAMHDAI